MTAITFPRPPGFADLPNSALAAEQFALAAYITRIADNAAFGMVRPEVFSGIYKSGDTVNLPVSAVDGYSYSRDELTYQWGLYTTVRQSDGWVSGKGSLWTGAWNVDQATGEVHCDEYYSTSDAKRTTSNDGILAVFTIAIRRKNSLVLAATPGFTAVADIDLTADKALHATAITRLNDGAKFGVVANEVIYCGEFTQGQVVNPPVSPDDGYAYSYAEVKFQHSWKWTYVGDGSGLPWDSSQVQLQRIGATIDGTGHVTLDVEYYNSGVHTSAHGRIAVWAYCKRTSAATALANDFAWINDGDVLSGAVLPSDVLVQINHNLQQAILRPEFFQASYAHGATVPLPVSPIDGYTYSRDELFYVWEIESTGPESNIRLIALSTMVNAATGLVWVIEARLPDGGSSVVWTNNGKVRVLTIAVRDAHLPALDIPAITPTQQDPGGEGYLVNGGFDLWSSPTQTVADGWTVPQLTAGASLSREPGLDGSPSAQGLSSVPGATAAVRSSQLSVKTGDRKAFAFKAFSTAVTTRGFYARVVLLNADKTSFVYFDVYGNVGLGTSTKQFFEWVEIPANGATTMLSSRGSLGVAGTLNFDPAWAFVDLFNADPNVASKYVLDEVEWVNQLAPSNGGIASVGSIGLAFFPAIPITLTDTTAAFDLSAPLQRNDGSTTPTGLGTVTITGLTPSTQYAVELYYDEIEKTVKATGAGAGHGSNGWAYLPSELSRALAVEWGDVSHLPLSEAPIYFTTTATGAPPGGGTGGGDGGCHREDVLVRRRNKAGEILTVPLRFVRPSEFLWNGGDEWTEVESNELRDHSDWIHFDFEGGPQDLPVTSGHTFEETDGRLVRAYEVGAISAFRTPTGRTSPTRIQRRQYPGRIAAVRCKAPHTFMVSTDSVTWVQSHNNNRLISTL